MSDSPSGRRRAQPIEAAVCSLQHAASRLGIHRSTAYELVKRGEFPLPVIRVGSQIKVSLDQLEHFLKTGELLNGATTGPQPVEETKPRRRKTAASSS